MRLMLVILYGVATIAAATLGQDADTAPAFNEDFGSGASTFWRSLAHLATTDGTSIRIGICI